MSDCLYHAAAIKARDTGVRDEVGLEGTLSYGRIGCYTCSGDNNRCLMYSVVEKRKTIITNLLHVNFFLGDGDGI